MRRSIRLALIAGILSTGCASPHQQRTGGDTVVVQRGLPAVDSLPPDSGSSVDTASAADSARLAFWAFAQRLGRNRLQLVRTLGAPLRVVGNTIRNEHNPSVLDSVVTLRYRGLDAEFYVRADGVELPSLIEVTDSSWSLPLRLRTGATRSDLKRLLGPSDYEVRQGDTLVVAFTVPDEAVVQNSMRFSLLSGVICKISWYYGLD